MGVYNTKVKIYNDGTKNALYCSEPIFGKQINERVLSDEELADKVKVYDEHGREVEILRPYTGNFCKLDFEEKQKKLEDEYFHKKLMKSKEDNSARSAKRAVDKVYDIVMQNDFSFFLTQTIDPSLLDSTNPALVMKKLSKWLNNMQQRKGLSYLLIPEYHKSGRIHMHALINDALTLIDTNRRIFHGKAYQIATLRRNGVYIDGLKPVYNLKEWKYGFTTAIPLDGERARVACYVTKYITKDLKKIFGQYYWSSRSLCRDVETEYLNVDYNSVDKVEFNSVLGRKFKYDFQSFSHSDNNDNDIERAFEIESDIDYSNIPWEK